MMPAYRHMWEFASNVVESNFFAYSIDENPLSICEVNEKYRNKWMTQYYEFTLVHAKTKPKRCRLFLVKHFGETTFLSNGCVCIHSFALACSRSFSFTYIFIDISGCCWFFRLLSFSLDICRHSIHTSHWIHTSMVRSHPSTYASHTFMFRPYSSYFILLVWLYTFVSLIWK